MPDMRGAGLDPADEVEALPAILGRNLRRLRRREGHSLDRLASLCGVSRAMLSQIETGKSTPTIAVLWKITTALDLPFAALLDNGRAGGTAVLRKRAAKILTSPCGGFTTRALFPFEAERRIEFYELRLAPGHQESAAAHAAGTVENLVVVNGRLEIRCGEDDDLFLVEEGDAIFFQADTPHAYRNPTNGEAVAYLVMSYVDPVG